MKTPADALEELLTTFLELQGIKVRKATETEKAIQRAMKIEAEQIALEILHEGRR